MANLLWKVRGLGTWVASAVLWFLIAQPVASQVTVLTVGPSGTYATIQGAIDVVVNGADTEIRVEQLTTYTENPLVPATFNSGTLSILGGWDATFTARDPDPEHTVINGSGIGRALDVRVEGGSFLIDGFTLTDGLSGGGIRVGSNNGSNSAQVVLRNLWIVDNHLSMSPVAQGGGLYALLRGTQRLEVLNCLFQGNRSTTWNQGSARGGAIFIQSVNDSTFLIDRCDILTNSVDSDGGERAGAGLYLRPEGGTAGLLYDTFVFENTITGTGTSSGSGGYLRTSEASRLEVVRTGWAGNQVVTGDATAQIVYTTEAGSHMLRMTDSGLAQGDSGGLDVTTASSGTVHLVNLTVADHPGTGILATQEDSSTLAIYNTISYGNGTDLTTSGTVDTGSNLIGIDPLFLDPPNLDYFLSAGSPAENTGDNDPPGGLSPLDIQGSSRVVDGIVDIGFAEGIDVIFACSFETGDLTTWVDDAN